MTIVTTSEAQAMLPQLLAIVARGDEVVITDGGRPVARLLQPVAPSPEPDSEEGDDRPWRGVFAIESPGEPYPEGRLQLPPEPLLPDPQPADILWDRMNSIDE